MTGDLPLQGQALVLGHDVNTDELHPSRFFSLDDARVRSGFLQAVPGRRGEAIEGHRIVVAGRNFGIGSSRETGARVFVLSGVQAVVAESYGRIFERNVMNLGLPAFVCPGIHGKVEEGEALSIDLQTRVLITTKGTYPLQSVDPYQQALVDAGGLMAWLGLSDGASS
jgi:3-isopropylmalate/(R)-2-methylmalate dehydratase small subunit